jgi:hypothetical protein
MAEPDLSPGPITDVVPCEPRHKQADFKGFVDQEGQYLCR